MPKYTPNQQADFFSPKGRGPVMEVKLHPVYKASAQRDYVWTLARERCKWWNGKTHAALVTRQIENMKVSGNILNSLAIY